MRNKSLIHTKDVKTQEGTPLHLEYYLINDSVLGGCAEKTGRVWPGAVLHSINNWIVLAGCLAGRGV